MHKRLYIFFLVFNFSGSIFAQSISFGDNCVEDLMRRRQILENKDYRSYLIRPVGTTRVFEGDTASFYTANTHATLAKSFSLRNIKGSIQAFPVDWLQQYNSRNAYGLNDGSMIPARGFQTLFSTGLHLELGWVSLQLKPEFVYANNPNFPTFSPFLSDTLWAYYYSFINRIDLPERFGNHVYKKIFTGQSNILMKIYSVSFGISTENMWWGPGFRNSLLMSNSAPGFIHFTIHTNKPIKTKIGNFEFQIIGGKLNASGIIPPDTLRRFTGRVDAPVPEGLTGGYTNEQLFLAKLDDWRYINGAIMTWQPKWTPNLFLGFERTFYEYNSQRGGSFLSKNLPIFSGFFRSNNYQLSEQKYDQLLAFIARLVLPKAHSEIYIEWGRNDNSQNLRDLLLEPDHSEALIIGGRKLFSLNRETIVNFQFELTQLGYSKDFFLIRPTEGWYTHYQVRDGYTNQGQMIGAGIGPGGESQTINISLIKKKVTFGLMLERYVHNKDFYSLVTTYANFKGNPWIDYSASYNTQILFKRFDINEELTLINSSNYEWNNLSSNYIQSVSNTLNIHLKISVRYYL